MPIEHFIFESLEPRTMLSADPFGLSDTLLDADKVTQSTAPDLQKPNLDTPLPVFPQALKAMDQTALENDELVSKNIELLSPVARETQLILIDSSIDNYQDLLSDINLDSATTQFEVQFIDSQSAGIMQLTEIFKQYNDLSAVHIFSHADQGILSLGNQEITQQALLNNSEYVAQWSAAFSESADFLLYGCNLAAGEYGIQFVNTLAQLTQLDVSASDDLSGSQSLQGNWSLERSIGNISSNLTFSEAAVWQGTLAMPLIATNALVIAQGEDITLDATNISATGNLGNDGLTNFTVSNITGGHFANSLDLTVPITSFIQSDVSSGNIHFIHNGGELAPSYDLTATYLADTTAVSSATINYSNTSDGALWLNLEGNINTGNGIPGLDGSAISKGDILQQAGPNFSMGEGNTDGTFSTAFDISIFSAQDETNGIHFVSSTIAIGITNPIVLQSGDLILSSKSDMVLASNGSGSPADLTLSKDNLVYFRPDVVGDYSKGNFYTLLDDPFGDDAEIRAVTLVENDVTVGDYQLKKGDFLFARNSGSSHSDIWLFRSEAIDTTNSASYPNVEQLINGEDSGVDIEGKLSGLDILEFDRNIGGTDYDAGTLLLSIENGDSDGVGTNSQVVTKYDIVALSVTKTTLGAGVNNAQVTASLFFDGDHASDQDVNIDSGSERIDSFSLTHSLTVANNPPTLNTNNFTFIEGQTTTIIDSFLASSDPESADQGVVYNISAINGGQFQLTSNLGVAITSFLQSHISNAEVIFIDDGNETAPSFSISISDGTNNTAAVAANINYLNANDAPTLTLNPTSSTFTEGDTSLTLFNTANANTIEAGQFFNALTFTVSNVDDINSEFLNIDGSALDLINGSGTTTANSFSYNISVLAGNATITLNNSNISAAAIETLLNNISYLNTSQDPTAGIRVITLTYLQDDGGTLNSGANSITPNIASTVTVQTVNDQPTLSLNPVSATYTEGDSSITLFNSASASTIEEGQFFSALSFTVSNLNDSNDEILDLDGTALNLVNGVGFTLNNGFTYSVSVVAGTATISLTGNNINSTSLETLLNNISYQNNSQDPTAGNRVITFTNLQDSGGDLNSGNDSINPNIAATITVQAVNDPPTLNLNPINATHAEGDPSTLIFNSAIVDTIEAGQFFNALTITISNLSDSSSEILNLDGSALTLVNASGTTLNNGFDYTITVVAGNATITLNNSNVSASNIETLLNNISYQNTSQDPTAGIRVITLTYLQDDGGVANAGKNTLTPNISATVNLIVPQPVVIETPVLIIDELPLVDIVDEPILEEIVNDFDNEIIIADLIETELVSTEDTPPRTITPTLDTPSQEQIVDSVISNDSNNRETQEPPQINLEIAEPDTSTTQLSFAISTVIASNNQLASKWSAQSDPLLLIKSSKLLDSLNNANKNIERSITIDAVNLGTGAVFSTGLSIGYVAWLLRSGIILSSVLSSLPAWRFIDPLPILSSLGTSEASQESLEDIVSEPNTASSTAESPSKTGDNS